MTTTFRERTSDREMRASHERCLYLYFRSAHARRMRAVFSHAFPDSDATRHSQTDALLGFELLFFHFASAFPPSSLIYLLLYLCFLYYHEKISTYYFKSCKKASDWLWVAHKRIRNRIFKNGESNYRNRVTLNALNGKIIKSENLFVNIWKHF